MSISQLQRTAGAPGLFRDAFRSHPAGVAVVTAGGPAGPVGLTASSVASVSADPDVLAFSVSGSRSANVLAAARTVLVHLMGSAQLDVVRAFATPGAERFGTAMDWEVLPTGEPLLRGAPWVLRCEVLHRMPAGESTLLAAAVLDVRQQGPAGDPLVYHDRAFHRLGGHSLLG